MKSTGIGSSHDLLNKKSIRQQAFAACGERERGKMERRIGRREEGGRRRREGGKERRTGRQKSRRKRSGGNCHKKYIHVVYN